MLEALVAVRRGEHYFSHSVRDRVLHDYVDVVRAGGSGEVSPLSPREREVLQLLAEGKSTKEMADTLNVSVKTVESHRKQIMASKPWDSTELCFLAKSSRTGAVRLRVWTIAPALRWKPLRFADS